MTPVTTELLNTLYVQTQGASLHLDGEAIRVYLPDDKSKRILPLRRYDALVVFGHVTSSADSTDPSTGTSCYATPSTKPTPTRPYG